MSEPRGRSSEAEPDPSKVMTPVRFRSPAPVSVRDAEIAEFKSRHPDSKKGGSEAMASISSALVGSITGDIQGGVHLLQHEARPRRDQVLGIRRLSTSSSRADFLGWNEHRIDICRRAPSVERRTRRPLLLRRQETRWPERLAPQALRRELESQQGFPNDPSRLRRTQGRHRR